VTGSPPLFENAVQIDPNYGRAYAALAAAYWQGSKDYFGLNQFGVSRDEGVLLAREYLEKAMENPTPLTHYLAKVVAFCKSSRKLNPENYEPSDLFCRQLRASWSRG